MADIELTGVIGQIVSQTVRATCMAGDCAFNLLAFQSIKGGMSVADLQDGVRIHVQLSGHRVYIDDRRGTIVARTKQS